MKRLAILVGAGVLGLTFAASASADGVRVIVGFKGRADPALVSRHGGEAGTSMQSARAVAAVVPAARLAALRAEADVAYVEEDGIAEALGKRRPPPPSQPAQTTPWGITRVGGRPSSTAGAGIDVAIIDTGIDLSHPDLAANVGPGISYVGYTSSPNDDNGHGTHVAGIVASIDNAIGVVGVAPGATVHPVKVLDGRGSGYFSDIVSGINWCATHGIKVANMSFGASTGSVTLEAACDSADAAGVLLIAAAGNSGDGSLATNEISYPAYYASVVSVGATASGDGLASFSNTNPDVEVSGPGVSVYSTYKSSTYATLSGTSMASPHAVGVAALLWADALAALSIPTNASVRGTLKADAQDAGLAGFDDGYGWGIVHHP